MEQNYGIARIATRLSRVLEDIKKVEKDGFNSMQNYKYATESSMLEMVRPLLGKHGLALWTEVVEEDYSAQSFVAKAKMKFSIIDSETGAMLNSIFVGKGKDKQEDKALYKAYTGANKYFLSKTFCLSSGDDPETDEQNNPNPQEQKQKQSYNNRKPYQNSNSNQGNNPKMISEKQINLLLSNKSTGLTEEQIRSLTSKEASEIIKKIMASNNNKNSNSSFEPLDDKTLKYINQLVSIVSKKEKRNEDEIRKDILGKFQLAELAADKVDKKTGSAIIKAIKDRISA